MDLEHPRLSRRTVFVGTGVGVIAAAAAACSTDTQQSAASSAPASSSSVGSTAVTTTEPAAPATPTAPKTVVKTAQVPLGSGVIIGDVVVTQPSAGVFTGLSAICTHQGCTVNKVADGTIDCPCHGSKFHLDGSVANGPATRPLPTKTVSVQGDSLVIG